VGIGIVFHARKRVPIVKVVKKLHRITSYNFPKGYTIAHYYTIGGDEIWAKKYRKSLENSVF
jgi:hypothetical protein